MSYLRNLEETVISLVAEIVETIITRDSVAGDLSEWDSLAQMKIIIRLEKVYDIEIEDENIAKLNSVANIVTYLQEKQL